MAQINVTPETMNLIAKDIDAKIEEWSEAVTKIYQLKDDMDAMWDGTANDSFNSLFAEDATKYNTLLQLMQEYSQAIKTAAAKYVESEEEVKNIVTKR